VTPSLTLFCCPTGVNLLVVKAGDMRNSRISTLELALRSLREVEESLREVRKSFAVKPASTSTLKFMVASSAASAMLVAAGFNPLLITAIRAPIAALMLSRRRGRHLQEMQLSVWLELEQYFSNF
jgi:hypothetical protein